MKSLLNQIESYEETKALQALRHQEKMYGQKIQVYEKTTTVYDSVYGSSSGEQPKTFFTIVGVTTGDDFFPQDAQRSGAFQEGYMYTTSKKEILPGALLSIVARDGKSRQYRVVAVEGVGTTREVFKKYQLSATDQR